jgi:hypothetical protein
MFFLKEDFEIDAGFDTQIKRLRIETKNKKTANWAVFLNHSGPKGI